MWAGANTYCTTDPSGLSITFSATENPISQGGKWNNGLADYTNWNNSQTTNATDGIYRAVGSAFVSGFNDPTSILKTSVLTLAPDQYAEGVIYLQSGYVPAASPSATSYHETQLRLRFTGSSGSLVGIEILFAYNNPTVSGDGYAVVRWNGVLGDFTTIVNGGGGSLPAITDGTVFRVELKGNTLTIKRNGSVVTTIDITQGGTIPTVSSGQPGFGSYPQSPNCTLDAYGWRSLKFGNL